MTISAAKTYESKSEPIFVLGKHRSGTTGLANQVSEHPEIVAVRHPAHEGIHESAYFSAIYGRYGDLSVKSNYRELAEVLSASDYFRLCGINTDDLMALWPTSYEGLFREVMDKFAVRERVRFWLEKTPQHTVHARKLAAFFPDARFISIIRPLEQVLASHLAYDSAGAKRRRKQQGTFGFIAAVALNRVYYNKIIHQLNNQWSGRTMVVQYEDFRDNQESVLNDICDFIGVEFDHRLLQCSYESNSSFKKKGLSRASVLTPAQKWFAQMVDGLAQVVPCWMFDLIHDLYRRIQPRRPLPNWFFRIKDTSEKTRERSLSE